MRWVDSQLKPLCYGGQITSEVKIENDAVDDTTIAALYGICMQIIRIKILFFL